MCIINETDFRIALYIKHETKNDIFRKCRLFSREHKNGKPVECVLYLKFIPLGLLILVELFRDLKVPDN